MNSRKIIFLALTIVVGALLVYIVYQPHLFKRSMEAAAAELPPALSAHPFHQAFVSEEACLSCHAQERELPDFGLVVPKIAHEPRRNCTGCHQLPAQD